MPNDQLTCPNSKFVEHTNRAVHYTIKEMVDANSSKTIQAICCSECGYIFGLVDPIIAQSNKHLEQIVENGIELNNLLKDQNKFLENLSKKPIHQPLSQSDIDQIVAKLSQSNTFVSTYNQFLISQQKIR